LATDKKSSFEALVFVILGTRFMATNQDMAAARNSRQP
jgi:hypothetical protein